MGNCLFTHLLAPKPSVSHLWPQLLLLRPPWRHLFKAQQHSQTNPTRTILILTITTLKSSGEILCCEKRQAKWRNCDLCVLHVRKKSHKSCCFFINLAVLRSLQMQYSDRYYFLSAQLSQAAGWILMQQTYVGRNEEEQNLLILGQL